MSVVMDTSMAVGWLLPSQETSLTAASLRHVKASYGLVPAHFGMEVAIALRRLERRGRIRSAEADVAFGDLALLDLRQDTRPAIESLQAIAGIARSRALKLADAAYLELAMRSGFPLATRDAALAAAARTAGVTLFGV